MSYTYKTILYKNPDALGLTANSHEANITDYEANHKSDGTEISSMTIGELDFETDGDYSWFNGTVVDGTNINWSDVKYIEDNVKYILIVSTTDPI